ncbi:hypothetical protein ACHAWF_003600 [Thalassiosira exigua]
MEFTACCKTTMALDCDRVGSCKENETRQLQQEENRHSPPMRVRLSARMSEELRRSSRDLMSSFGSVTSHVTFSPSVDSAFDVRHQTRGDGTISSDEMDELLTMPSLLDTSEVQRAAAEEERADAQSDMERQLDEEIERLFGVNEIGMDEAFVMPTDNEIAKEIQMKNAAGTHTSFTTSATTCSESAYSSEDDAIAREVGLSAHEYLEYCFYTEVSVLDREKFNAVPEILKSDFAVLGHLGKGSFSDVFEVVCKGGQWNGNLTRNRSRRTTFSSINAATLSHPSRVSDAVRRRYALKCLRPQIRSDLDQFAIGAEDLVHETAILANLDHPNIIKLHGRASGSLMDAFILNDGYFVLLDKLDETLVDRLEAWKQDPARPRMGPGRAQLEVARTVAEAMRYLHHKCIVFRDLKPANVGFDPQGTLKLFDFGFAAGLPEASPENPGGLLEDRCGTPRYMAPEVGLNLGYALPADVYSFGILFWEMCALSKPFLNIRSSDTFDRKVFVGGVRPPVDPGWPAALGKLMESCWVTLPGRRPTMDEVLSQLSSIPDDVSTNKGRKGPQPPIKARKVGAKVGRFRRSVVW